MCQERSADACAQSFLCPSSPCQVEYYFSDMSFPFDEFLQSVANEQGAVPLAILADSPRVVAILPGTTTEQRSAVLAAILPESDTVLLAAGGV